MKKENFFNNLPHWLMIICIILILLFFVATNLFAQKLNEQDVSNIVNQTLSAQPNNGNAYGLLLIILGTAAIYFVYENKKKDVVFLKINEAYSKTLQEYGRNMEVVIQSNTSAMNRVSEIINSNDDKIINAIKNSNHEHEKNIAALLNSNERTIKELLKENHEKHLQAINLLKK